MVVVGGITRLTESGLSITEWAPVTGALPPLSETEWNRQFEAYRQTTEYAQVNAGMSLEEFKGIFWWEWAHRLLGRVIGLAFALPFFVLLFLGRIPRRHIDPARQARDDHPPPDRALQTAQAQQDPATPDQAPGDPAQEQQHEERQGEGQADHPA